MVDAFSTAFSNILLRVSLPAAASCLVLVGLGGAWLMLQNVSRRIRRAFGVVTLMFLGLWVLAMGGSGSYPTRDEKEQNRALQAEIAAERAAIASLMLAGGTPRQQSGYGPMQTIPSWEHGIYEDGARIVFPDGWVFPFGSNHLASVEVMPWGAVSPDGFSRSQVAAFGPRLSMVPGVSSFHYGMTSSNSCAFEWSSARDGRINGEPFDGRIELFRNGDVSVTTNGVAALLPRELPFPHSGFGQDDEWVAANFTNATEILAVGYPQWVDAQVGEGLTNGLYKLSAAVADDPPETTFLSVGELSVAITNAGEYVFLLEKGPAYDLTVFPPSSNVTISAVDDVPTMRGTPMMRSIGDPGAGHWVPDSGDFWTDYVAGMGHARLWWLPWLCGSPDVVHVDPMAGPVTFHADLLDYRGSAASFLWTGSDALTIASPNSQATAVTADLADWRLANLSVTASFGFDRSLTSYLYVSYGTNDSPQVSCSLSVQSVHFINEGDRPERVYPVSVSLFCPVETNGVVSISHEGSDGALFWSDAAATQPLSSLSGILLSSVAEESGSASYTFYMTSPNVGSGSFTASFTLPSGETRGASKPYRAIEPIRKLVCSEIDPEYSCVFNPSRLVYGHPARLKVGVNGNFSPSDVEWSIVSGPGTVTRGEDDFGDADWTATVTATSTNGEVVVEARFNEDPIQPRFVLPIVQMRTIPIEAYVVCASNGVGATTQAAIEEKICNANIIWKQAGVQFQLDGVVVEMPFPQYFVLSEREIVTNSMGAVELGKFASRDVYDLMAQVPTNNGIKTFWVGSITNGTPIAFTMQRHKSVFASQMASGRAFAHELGHAIGLADIYVKRKIRGGVVVLPYAGYHVSKDFFDDKICDWGSESACGFYQRSDNLGIIISSLLMHGTEVPGASEVADLPSGSVLGFGKDVRSVFSTTNVVVGVNGITE